VGAFHLGDTGLSTPLSPELVGRQEHPPVDSGEPSEPNFPRTGTMG